MGEIPSSHRADGWINPMGIDTLEVGEVIPKIVYRFLNLLDSLHVILQLYPPHGTAGLVHPVFCGSQGDPPKSGECGIGDLVIRRIPAGGDPRAFIVPESDTPFI